MRITSRIIGLTAGIVVLCAMALPGVGGAVPVPIVNELVVTKIVEGPVPPGTEFVVEVDCSSPIKTGAGAEGFDDPDPIVFGEEGGSETIQIPPFVDECTVTETDDGGASSVVYGGEDNGCDITATDSDVTADFPGFAPGADPSGGPPPIVGVTCEVTVTNTFDPPPEPAPAAQPAANAAAAVPVGPRFTG